MNTSKNKEMCGKMVIGRKIVSSLSFFSVLREIGRCGPGSDEAAGEGGMWFHGVFHGPAFRKMDKNLLFLAVFFHNGNNNG